MFAVAASNVNGGLVDFFHGVQVAIMFGLMTNILQFAWWKIKGKNKNATHWKRNRPLYLLTLAMILVCTQPVCMLVIGSWNIDNFFFDGSDYGISCTSGDMCNSKTCSSVMNKYNVNTFLVKDTWSSTGCNSTAPEWAFAYFVDGGATASYDYCTSASGSAEYLTCHGTSAVADVKCQKLSTPEDPTACQNGDSTCTCAMDTAALVPNTTIGIIIQIFGTYLGFILMFCGVFEATQLHKKIIKQWRALRI